MTDNTPIGNSDWLAEYGIALKDEVTCDATGCRRVASLYTRVRCCGAVFMYCSDCMKNVYEVLMKTVAARAMVTCPSCHKQSSAVQWAEVPKELALDTTS